MNIQSGLSGHWTDEQMIDHLYELGPQDGHLVQCVACRNRLASLKQNRLNAERALLASEPTAELLAAQRRRIYARLEQQQNTQGAGPFMARVPRWASATAVVVFLGGALFLAEDGSRITSRGHSVPAQQTAAISDAQLASEVSQLAASPEPSPTKPLQALFAE